MRKALCVGIDYYESGNSLEQCVSDAQSIAKVLARHENGDKNFDVECLCTGTRLESVPVGFDPETEEILFEKKIRDIPISAKLLKSAAEMLFDPDKNLEVALFYFAGHGYCDANGGYLCASDSNDPSDGLSLDYLMRLVSGCKASHKIIILDSCHSGYAGKLDRMGEFSHLPENTTILASCTNRGTAADGCFTPLMVEALEGGAMNLMGEVSPGDVYSYIDRALGSWDQRPVFKANIESFVCLRKNKEPISKGVLQQIVDIFPDPNEDKPLDPGYEEDKHEVDDPVYQVRDPEKERVFSILRDYVALNLVVPVGAPRMYQAAIHSKACRLTNLGRYYWRLVATNRI